MPTSPGLTGHNVAALYSEHHRWLQSWIKRKLGNAFDAADLAQDTFTRMLTHPAFQPEHTDAEKVREPRAYILTIAYRLVINHQRRQSLEQAYLAALAILPEPMAPSPEHQLIIRQTLQENDAMLSGIAPKARAVFVMSQVEGLSYDEIAAQLELSSRTVKRYMAQAMAECIVATGE